MTWSESIFSHKSGFIFSHKSGFIFSHKSHKTLIDILSDKRYIKIMCYVIFQVIQPSLKLIRIKKNSIFGSENF